MPRPSAYQPLSDFLAAAHEDEIILTFAAIEAILDAALPPSATTKGGSWSNAGNSYVRTWRALGWSVRIDRRRGVVTFTRAVEG